MQPRFFDLDNRYAQLSKQGDPLEKLSAVIDWELFRPIICRMDAKPRKSLAGRKPTDRVLMFKVLILQRLHNLADERLEFQIKDRLSFMRFLGLELADKQLSSQIHERAYKDKPLTDEQNASNKAKSKIRARVEHVFGHMQTSMGGMLIRSIGMARAHVAIGLMSLAYNLTRIECLIRTQKIKLKKFGKIGAPCGA
jgi:Transposase domain (DUF772)/Transposase DDE domain